MAPPVIQLKSRIHTAINPDIFHEQPLEPQSPSFESTRQHKTQPGSAKKIQHPTPQILRPSLLARQAVDSGFLACCPQSLGGPGQPFPGSLVPLGYYRVTLKGAYNRLQRVMQGLYAYIGPRAAIKVENHMATSKQHEKET